MRKQSFLIWLIIITTASACFRQRAYNQFKSTWKNCDQLGSALSFSQEEGGKEIGKFDFYKELGSSLKDSTFIGFEIDCISPIIGPPDFIYDKSQPSDTLGLLGHSYTVLSRKEIVWTYVLKLEEELLQERDSLVIFHFYFQRKNRRISWVELDLLKFYGRIDSGFSSLDSSCFNMLDELFKRDPSFELKDANSGQISFYENFDFRKVGSSYPLLTLPCLEKCVGQASSYEFYYYPNGGYIIAKYLKGLVRLEFDINTLSCTSPIVIIVP